MLNSKPEQRSAFIWSFITAGLFILFTIFDKNNDDTVHFSLLVLIINLAFIYSFLVLISILYLKRKYKKELEKYVSNSLAFLTDMSAVEMGFNANISASIVSASIDEAKNLGIFGKDKLGDEQIKNTSFLSERLNAGLTREDILEFRNQDPVLHIINEKIANGIRFAVFSKNTEEGLTPEDATMKLRKTMIYYGEPGVTNTMFEGEDADIYHEFASRYEKWRSSVTIEEEQKLASKFSTYNAFVRKLIEDHVI